MVWLSWLASCALLGKEAPADCNSCADLFENAYCVANSSCVPVRCDSTGICLPEEAGACAWGLLLSDEECEDPQQWEKTALPVDCRGPLHRDDPRCANPYDLEPNTIGDGLNIDSLELNGGFIDRDGGRVVVSTSGIDSSAVISIDLETGDREILSGRIFDDLLGPVEVGRGELPTSLGDVQRDPSDGSWIALDTSVGGAEIYRIDPETGDRSVLYEQGLLGSEEAVCRLDGYGLLVGWEVPILPQEGTANLVVGEDGTIWVRASRAGSGSEDLGIEGIVALRGGSCDVLTAYSAEYPFEIGVGDGPAVPDYYSWLVRDGERLLAIPSSYVLHAIDLASGARTTLSSADTSAPVGDGPELGSDCAVLSADGQTLWTAGPYADGVVGVDVESGERGGYPSRSTPAEATDLEVLLLDPDLDDVLIVLSDGVALRYEPKTGNSNLLAR